MSVIPKVWDKSSWDKGDETLEAEFVGRLRMTIVKIERIFVGVVVGYVVHAGILHI